MRKIKKQLKLSRETILKLSTDALRSVQGGDIIRDPCDSIKICQSDRCITGICY